MIGFLRWLSCVFQVSRHRLGAVMVFKRCYNPVLAAVIVAMVGSMTGLLSAQVPELEVRMSRSSVDSFRPPAIHVDVDLVLMPVVVTNRKGSVVNGLAASSFTVLEDNASRPILSFGSEDVPCSVGIIVDISGSMAGKTSIAAGAMRAFLIHPTRKMKPSC